MKVNRHPFLAAVLVVGMAAVGSAEILGAESPVANEELELLREETVVTASRYEQPISQAPSIVYVITDEDILQSGAPDIPTILRRIPGMEVMQTTAAEFNVSIRGDNHLIANKLLVLVDGRSIYIDAHGNVNWKNLPVTLPEIKRIEVVKGPASAVWGFNAFDGVVNIITKSPEEMKGTTVQIAGGQFGTWTNSAIHAGTQGKFGYRFSVGHDQAQQWSNRDALGYRAYKFNLLTTYALSSSSTLSFSGGLVDANRFDGNISETTNSNVTPAQGYAYLDYTRSTGFLRAWWTGNYDTDRLVPLSPLTGFLSNTDVQRSSSFSSRFNTYNVEGQETWNLSSSHLLTTGVNYRLNTASSNFLSGFAQENRLGFYIQDEWRLAPSLTAIGGVRYDLDTFISPRFSPRFTLLYSPTSNHTFRAGVAVAYRPPTIFETRLNILNQFTIPTPGGPVSITSPTFGSSALDAEKIISYDLGYQGWFFKHRLRTRVDLFFNHISDLVSFEATASTPQAPVRAVNGGIADIYGGETGVEVLFTRWLSGFANFAYQEVGQSLTGQAQRAVPRFKGNAGLRADWERVSAEVWLHHYGSATYPLSAAFSLLAPFGAGPVPDARAGSYNLLMLRAGYRFWHNNAEVAVSVFNALNDEHREHPLGELIQRRIMGWLTVKF
jgi:iron complex outermembrane receptor protein